MLVRCIVGLAVPAVLLGAPASAPAQVALADGCFTLGAGAGGPLFFKPTGEGTYLLHDRDGLLVRVRGGAVAHAGGPETAGPDAEWRVAGAGSGRVIVVSAANGLGLAEGGGALVLRDYGGARLRITPASGCPPFPEAEVGAVGTSVPPRKGASLVGFADAHLHLVADLRAGGRVIHGRAFDRFGIARALGDDALDHGPDGSLDVTGNLLRDGVPFGTHDTQGWPGFTGWPVHDTNTHQQTYWVWLQRAWKATHDDGAPGRPFDGSVLLGRASGCGRRSRPSFRTSRRRTRARGPRDRRPSTVRSRARSCSRCHECATDQVVL